MYYYLNFNGIIRLRIYNLSINKLIQLEVAELGFEPRCSWRQSFKSSHYELKLLG